ncbi:hypothetical protein SERLA73DRAFT_27267, partial [Serpula lacrymans var. lacrymans S7.3]
RPQNPQEYFDLRHASARNIIEHIFGVLKRQFSILKAMSVQALIPPAVCFLHNFIHTHNPTNDKDNNKDTDLLTPDNGNNGELSYQVILEAACLAANSQQDKIAQEMWVGYPAELQK